MKKRWKQIVVLGLSASMLAGATACASDTGAGVTSTESGNETGSGSAAPAASAEVEELGSGDVKWSEETTADGWVKVTNEGGATLGYSSDSGVKLLQSDGYAFKDLNQNGELDVYEDWRLDPKVRAEDLASKLEADDMAGLLTHGGWMSFGTELGDDEEYLEAGGRAGVTRSASNEGNTEMAITWTNMLQEYAEKNGGFGIPVTISVDPCNISGTVDQNGLGATMNTDLAYEIGKENAADYRSVGITMLLGPQIDVASNSSWDRASGTYSEDPALNRDLAKAYISGLQSTFSESGEDEGWGDESVIAIAKHFVGAGASEGGRNDHNDTGKFTVFPGNNFEAHLIPYFDGAFKLDTKTETAAGVMPNYAISYSDDGSLGDLVGGGYSAFKINLLRDNGYEGFILTDWGITEDDGRDFGMNDVSEAERFAALIEVGVDQVGGTTSVDACREGIDIVLENMGEEEGMAQIRSAVARFFITQINVGLFENPYVSLETAKATVWDEASVAYGVSTQLQGAVMIKNKDNTIHQYDAGAEKQKVYIPYVFTAAETSWMGTTPASWAPAIDIEIASQYYDVVTDTLKDPSGTDEEGNPAYTEEDITRASASELADCDLAIVSMRNAYTDGTKNEEGNYLPASLQYEEYTADTAHEAIANGTTVIEKNDGYYGTVTETVPESRTYTGQTVGRATTYGGLETLQYVKNAVPADCKVVATVGFSSALCMVWSEVEPLADAILVYYGGVSVFGSSTYTDDVLIQLIAGTAEPSGLLPMQQPASMEAVEAQLEDVPRDVECYVDSEGNTYDFTFGMNWSGVISDERVSAYSAEPLTKCESISFSYAK